MSLDVFQQVFRLSLLSNGVTYCTGDQATLQKQLEDYLADEIPKTGTGWELAWGPVVWKFRPNDAETVPENAWFIAFHPSLQFEDGTEHPTYVVAIAGTPVNSKYVWYFENFQVYSVTDFTSWVTGGIQNPPASALRDDITLGKAYIAKGTVDAVHLLLNTSAPAGTTLLDFFNAVDQSASPRFIFTGHSLGGALSPSLALSLVAAEVISSDVTLTYPSAGPSPGNIPFSSLFSATFPARKEDGSSSYQGWNLNLVNTLDIVPQAWAASADISKEQNLLNIPTIYGKPPIYDVGVFVGAGLGISSVASGVLYKPIENQTFTGTAPSETPTTIEQFLAIASRQHVHAYTEEIGVTVELVCSQGA